MSNLALRWLTAAILIPPVVWVCKLGGLAYVALVIGFAVAAVNEFYNLISFKGARPHRLLGTAAVALLPVIVYVGDLFYATSLMTAVLLALMILQLAQREIHEAIASVSATFFGVFYVGWLLAHAVSVRFISEDLVRRYGDLAAVDIDPAIGFFYIMLCLAAVYGCDTGAYFVGRAYGRRKLAPANSPNKTLEGALGGLVAGALCAVGAKAVLDYLPGNLSHDLSYAAAVTFGLLIAIAAIAGDLVESLLKRDADVKDAGSLLPGGGGVLDRVDSALLAIPVTYYLLLAYYYLRLGV